MRFSFVGISSSTLFLLFYWVLNSSFSQSYDDTDPDIETPANLGLKKRWWLLYGKKQSNDNKWQTLSAFNWRWKDERKVVYQSAIAI